jgi:hypothetical protein
MFDASSRYAPLTVQTQLVKQPNGELRAVRCIERRFLPASGAGTTLAEHSVAQGDRLDNITAKYLGDPAQFWRVADANESMRPEELTDEIGRRITIKLPH